jgi:hypothetical protein
LSGSPFFFTEPMVSALVVVGGGGILAGSAMLAKGVAFIFILSC